MSTLRRGYGSMNWNIKPVDPPGYVWILCFQGYIIIIIGIGIRYTGPPS
jgi:hypothetical protein